MRTCKYCSIKRISPEQTFCSKECQDNFDSALACNKIKGAVMDAMRDMAKDDKAREKKFLQSLIACLTCDLQDRMPAIDRLTEQLQKEGWKLQRDGVNYINGSYGTSMLSKDGEVIHIIEETMPDEEMIKDLFGRRK